MVGTTDLGHAAGFQRIYLQGLSDIEKCLSGIGGDD